MHACFAHNKCFTFKLCRGYCVSFLELFGPIAGVIIPITLSLLRRIGSFQGCLLSAVLLLIVFNLLLSLLKIKQDHRLTSRETQFSNSLRKPMHDLTIEFMKDKEAG